MAGRPRKPTAVLEASGAFKKNPDRKRDGEPEVKTPLGSPPDYLDDDVRACWLEFAGQAPIGVLTSADRNAVEIAAGLMSDYRKSRAPLEPGDEPRPRFPSSDHARLFAYLSQFGMTPADRSKLNIAKPKAANPFDEFK